MAYSGKITIPNTERKPFVSAFSEIIRFLCGNTSVAGRDWEIIFTELDTLSGNFSYIQYTGQLNVTENNVWMNLPTAFVTEYTFTRGGQTLVEETDYTLDWKLGKIKFLTGTPPYTVNYDYKFKRYRIVLKNTDAGRSTYVGFLMISNGYDKAQILTRCYKGFLIGTTTFFDTTFWGNERTSNAYDCAFGFWNGLIDIWIFSNRRRIIIVARNNTYYTFCYVGRFLPFALPNEYLYPLAVVTDLNTHTDPSNGSIRWHDSTDENRRYIARAYFGTSSYMNNQVVYFDNSWVRDAGMIPFYITNYWTTIAYMEGMNRVLLPAVIAKNYPLGVFEGCYLTPGLQLSSESEITVGSDTYIIFQDCFRTTYIDYMAIKEE